MLEDINDPFNPVARRPARPSHPAGRPSPPVIPTGRLVVPAPAPDGRGDDATTLEDRPPSNQAAPVFRITPDPGPGEVTPPKRWNQKR